jgi:hypothetical protein
MMGWEGIHWGIVVDNVLFRINAVVSKAEIVERVIHLMKPVKYKITILL